MIHRGPDDAGLYHDASAALGVRRLSILDIPGGHQPIPNEDRTVWVVLNGEIYNYRSLRDTLQTAGHRFTTRSDTEVIAHLYEAEGERFVESLRGMFAIALWDVTRQRLILARDRLGIKPLYYTTLGKRLLFASELKALLKHPDVSPTINLEALDRYLLHEYVPAPDSILQGIRKLPQGHRLMADAGGLHLEPYWQLRETPRLMLTEREAVAQLDRLVTDTVTGHLQSDVPVGVLLSGGLDSGLILSEMNRQGLHDVPAFTIGFEDPSFDETARAAAIARRCHARHIVRQLTVDDVLESLPDITAAMDEPLGDPSAIPTWWLSQLAGTSVKVALSGDGGDELFGGYPTYLAHRWATAYDRVPETIRRAITTPPGIRQLPVSHRHMSWDFKLNRFLRGAGRPAVERHYLWMGSFGPTERDALWVPGMAPPRPAMSWPAHMPSGNGRSGDPAEDAMALDRRTYLPDDLLAKVDRMSMAHGLEIRVPLLDHTIVEFAARLPATLHVRQWQTKILIRRLLSTRLPRQILQHPKKGFGVPMASWLCGPLRPLATAFLAPDRVARRGLWNPAYVQQLLQEHWGRVRNHAKPLWTLLAFELWAQHHLERAPVA